MGGMKSGKSDAAVGRLGERWEAEPGSRGGEGRERKDNKQTNKRKKLLCAFPPQLFQKGEVIKFTIAIFYRY